MLIEIKLRIKETFVVVKYKSILLLISFSLISLFICLNSSYKYSEIKTTTLE